MSHCGCGAALIPAGGLRHCTDCHRVLSSSTFHKNPNAPDGRRGRCKSCERRRAERRSAANPSAGARRSATWRLRHPLQAKLGQRRARALLPPEVIAAQLAVRHAIRAGKLVRADRCAHCGGSGRIEAAHVDYSRPLEVIWLCTRCHRKWDARLPKHAPAA